MMLCGIPGADIPRGKLLPYSDDLLLDVPLIAQHHPFLWCLLRFRASYRYRGSRLFLLLFAEMGASGAPIIFNGVRGAGSSLGSIGRACSCNDQLD